MDYARREIERESLSVICEHEHSWNSLFRAEGLNARNKIAFIARVLPALCLSLITHDPRATMKLRDAVSPAHLRNCCDKKSPARDFAFDRSKKGRHLTYGHLTNWSVTFLAEYRVTARGLLHILSEFRRRRARTLARVNNKTKHNRHGARLQE